ncbi:class I SAM-dependent methyltransferase [Thermodesulfobacteriota bacterium]
MENPEEAMRLEIKTDPDEVRQQALFCGLKPGLRVLDAGCGPGKTTFLLNEMIQPGGKILGVDYSKERIEYARTNYGSTPDIEFRLHDLRDPLKGENLFDLIWVRFVLEYNRVERPEIIKNLTDCLKPGGVLCLMDLDHNALNHYGLPEKMETIFFEIMRVGQKKYNFDPYAGRKLYAGLHDLGYEDIKVDVTPHHLIYGEVKKEDLFNWCKKVEVAVELAEAVMECYPGGSAAFTNDFIHFFTDPRRFTYTPLIICIGKKPINASI